MADAALADAPRALGPEALTGADLARLGRELRAPFDVALASETGPVTLRCDAVLRLLPGRRIVARAQLDGAVVLAKLFVGSRAKMEREWEERGHQAFVRAGVATPPIVGGGTLKDGGAALLFEYVDDAVPATEADLLKTMPILAKLHAHGVLQSDLHLGNVLQTPRGIVLVDGGGVSGMAADKPLPRRASLRNLALFLAQFGVRAEAGFVQAWHAYCVARGFKTIDADGGELLTAVRAARRARVRDYMHKVLRDCSEFHAERRFDRVLVCERAAYSPELEAAIDDIDAQFERGAVIKSGNTATVVRRWVDGDALIIKRYNIKSWRHALSRALRPTRAQRAWQNAHRLRLLGIPTFHPVALVEARFGPLRRRAYLVMRDVGGVDLGERFNKGHVRQVAELFADLYRAEVVMGDTKATNFIDAGGTIHLIDLDALRAPWTERGLRRAMARDVRRFIANWSGSATIRAALERAFAAALPFAPAGGRQHE